MRAFPVLPPVSRRATSGGAALDIRASVGTSTSPTSTGTKAVTGVGFTPKCLLDFNGLMESFVNADSNSLLTFGAAQSASSRASISVSSSTSVTTSATNRRHSAAGVISTIDAGTPSVILAADLSSFNADGFTRSFSTVVGSARNLYHICLGGADLEVSLVQCQMNGTNAAQSFAHGLSGAPTGVLFFSAPSAAAPPNTASELYLSIGAWAASSQFSAQAFSANAVTTTSTRRALTTTACCGFIDTAYGRTMAVGSVDATNVNVTYPVTLASTQVRFWMLCIRGAKCQVGTFDCNGSTSPLTIATTGITPKLFLPVFVPLGVDNVGTVQNDLLLSIGACDGTNNVSCGISDDNGVPTTNARRFQSSTSLVEYDDSTGALRFQGTAAFSGESVILTPTTISSSAWGQGAFLVVGS